MRVTDLCPSPHLEAMDIGDDIGSSKIVTIKSVEIREVGAEKVRKGVVLFDESARGMVLNKTNSRTIAALFGPETDKWIGEKITIYRSETSFQNKTVPCIRVKDVRPVANGSETAKTAKKRIETLTK